MAASCPICTANSELSPTETRVVSLDCPRCGPYLITHEALAAIKGEDFRKEPTRWAVTSHALRRTGSTKASRFTVNTNWLASVWETNRLPNPQQQANYFVDYLGQSGHAPDQWIDCPPIEIAGIIGTADEPQVNRTSGLTYVINNLLQERIIEPHSSPRSSRVEYRLAFPGWARFEELRKLGIEINIAFMAMGYGNPSVDRAFSEFRTAISRLGVELRRLDTKPKSGLIDLRMRVDLRSAKFAVVDLTDENRGAYWEAGFAEGCGKKVYYVCEETKFDSVKTHFDTEHLFTVKWDLAKMESALDDLTAAIQNDFPEYAMAPAV